MFGSQLQTLCVVGLEQIPKTPTLPTTVERPTGALSIENYGGLEICFIFKARILKGVCRNINGTGNLGAKCCVLFMVDGCQTIATQSRAGYFVVLLGQHRCCKPNPRAVQQKQTHGFHGG